MKKKNLTKILSLALCAAIGTSTFVGCGPGDSQEQINENQTQLYVNLRYAGLGDLWMKRYKEEFEKFYAETSFEEGKKGVQVIIDYTYSGGYDVLKNLITTRAEVIWSEAGAHHQIATDGIALDLSEIIKEPLTEFGETATIESKMEQSLLDYYRATDGKVYVLPWFDYFKGTIYDVDIFEGRESDGQGFYIAKDGGFTNGLEGSPAKSAGPNNIEGDYDDGLPSNYDEFFDMMDEMLVYGITPFTFPGLATTYMDSFFINLWLNNEGEEAAINYTFDGTATDLINVAADGTITELPDTKITNENGYMIFKQEGRYRAYQFLEKFIKNPMYYSVNAFDAAGSQTQAEEDFLYGVVDGQEKIAMIVDGLWWESEATSIFEAMELLDENYSKENRRFAWMPMPFYEDSSEERSQTMVTEKETHVLINKNIAPEKIEVAKKFLQFTSTDAMLIATVEEISTPRSLKVSDTSKFATADLTSYGASVIEALNEATILSRLSTNKFQWSAALGNNQLFCMSTVNGAQYNSLVSSFYNESELTAANFFEGLTYGAQSQWQDLLNSYEG